MMKITFTTNLLFALVAGVAALCLAIGSYWVWFNSPDDALHGEMVRMLYLHLPFAYSTVLCYLLLAVVSLLYLLQRKPVYDRYARCFAGIGMFITAITLFSGSLWGQIAWGTWWVWDARLTSVLVLFFIYAAYFALRYAYRDNKKAGIPAAILVMIGLLDVPIVKFSVYWWNTIHQKSSLFDPSGIAIHPSMQIPLLWMAIAIALMLVLWGLLRYRKLSLQDKMAEISQNKAFSNLASLSGKH